MKSQMADSITKEIYLRKDYLRGQSIDTIYFGGGTPSLFSQDELGQILKAIQHVHDISSVEEITIEVNPDDITIEKAFELRSLGFNRLSIGIQSFMEKDMQYMHRAHTASQSHSVIEICKTAGFENISVDLIYGIPDTNLEGWKENLKMVSEKNIQHLSCYALTVEPETALAHQIKNKKAKPVDDEATINQFELLMNTCSEYGFYQYEISNFCKPGFESKHNKNYWNGIPYLGLGPSAHSFDGQSREWNIAHNIKYINAINNESSFSEKELLTEVMIYNETILTRLRTIQGLDVHSIAQKYQEHLLIKSKILINQGLLIADKNYLRLTREGIYISDKVILELFL